MPAPSTTIGRFRQGRKLLLLVRQQGAETASKDLPVTIPPCPPTGQMLKFGTTQLWGR